MENNRSEEHASNTALEHLHIRLRDDKPVSVPGVYLPPLLQKRREMAEAATTGTVSFSFPHKHNLSPTGAYSVHARAFVDSLT